MFNIEFFTLPDGSVPALETIRSISDVKLKAKVFRSLKLLESFGNQLGEPDIKHLRNGIFELRTRQGSNIFRNLFFFHSGRIIVVTNGFIKKTQKTPEKEIILAERRRSEYEAEDNKEHT